jgi:CheY-like chemotaxis protein
MLTSGAETILVVDDDAAVRHLTAALLERGGYSVIEAESGPVAIERFTENPGEVQLILSDVVMPQMTGTEMIHRIRSIDPSVPVMLMTGCAINTILPDAVPVISKPFTSELLLKTVRDCLKPAFDLAPVQEP